MGVGASVSKKYVLRAIETTELDLQASSESAAAVAAAGVSRSRKPTMIYPVQEVQDSFDYAEVKIKPSNRRGSASNSSLPVTLEDGRKTPLTRLNSKVSEQSAKLDGGSSRPPMIPTASTKGMMVSAPSNKNLLPQLGSSSISPLNSQPSTRNMIRSNSISVSRNTNSTNICSTTCPWLLKGANVQGQSLSDFELGRVIGRGLMGTVRIAKNKNGKYLVFKGVKKDYIVKHNDQRHVQNERDILKTLNCSFCVKMFGTFQDKSNIYYALEYCPGGELFQRLGKKRFFPPDEAKFYLSEVFIALEHVQSLGFVYRDLKPENIILDEEGHCKLVDFGFSTPCSDNNTKLHTLCGTPAYLSPEQLDGKFTNGYTRVVDWWSYGVLAYELLTGKTPFCHGDRETHYEIFLRILNKKIYFPWGFDGTAKDLVSKLCHAHLDKRLCSANEIKAHPFFTMPWGQVALRKLVPPFVPRIKEEGDIHYFKSYALPKDSLEENDNRYGYFDF